MPVTMGNEISGFVAGEPLDIFRDVLGVPEGQLISSASLKIANSSAEVEESPIIDSQITVVSSIFGQILDTGP